MLSEAQKAWAAGFFDGEGHIRKDWLVVEVVQVDPAPLQRLWQWFGGRIRNDLEGEKKAQAEAALLQWRPKQSDWCWKCGSFERNKHGDCTPCQRTSSREYQRKRRTHAV